MPMRVEILDGVERRRRWSDDEKARITEDSFAPGAKVSEVARKHGVSRSLIFAWRREARVEGLGAPAVPRLIPVHVATSASSRVVMQEATAQTQSWLGESGQNDKWIFRLTVASIAAHQERS